MSSCFLSFHLLLYDNSRSLDLTSLHIHILPLLHHTHHKDAMASTSYYPYATTSSLPMSVPRKGVQQSPYGRQITSYGQFSASPPERPASISSSSGAGLYSSASSQYASSEYDSSSGATSVDLLDYMNDRLAQAYNPIPQDRSMARQAQM